MHRTYTDPSIEHVSRLNIKQLREEHMHVRSLKSGERVIVNPTIAVERIYDYFHFFINVDSLGGQLTKVYAELHASFYLSYTIPMIMLCLCPLAMWWDNKRCERRQPGGFALVLTLKT